jgi:M6 family metalloprotease-like protein
MIIEREWNTFTWDNSSAGSFQGKCKKKDKGERNCRKVLKLSTFLPFFLHFAYLTFLTDAVPAPSPFAQVPKPTAPVPKPKPVAPAPKPTPAAPAPKPKPAAPEPKISKPAAPVPKPTTPVPKPLLVGTKKMLMIPIKFSDHMERAVPGTEYLTMIMNSDVDHKQLCPFGSVKNYFSVNSYGLLELDSTVVPWVKVPKTEAFYGNGSSGYNNYWSHMLIRDALEALEATNFDFAPFDTDNDGYIDAVGFFHSGYDGVFEKPDVYGTGHPYRIRSHSGNLYSLPGGKWTSSSGISVTNYHISTTFSGTSGAEIVPVGTVVYHIARFLGLPRLDDGKGLGEGLGRFCLMGTGYLGWDGSRSRPSLMSAWPKIQAGWVVPIDITSSGSYTAGPACSVPDVFKISKNFPENEYLLIENRYPCSYDTGLPGSGLAVYHIDESKPDNNDAGYPGQSGWPENGKHYRVALLPGHGQHYLETYHMDNIGSDAYRDYFLSINGESIGPVGVYYYYVNGWYNLGYPTTNTYKNGAINSTCITITATNSQYPSEKMYFDVSFQCTS